ncbi:hypothetical protein MNB_SV-12-693 [hydrothermal vent metagenome]|uniref:Uncharacterized protein n=1 Tax=hydrothermal vent metagenome TaxID=652676 RepID=A0A1W1BUV1_9ZZZZ
MRGKVLLFDKDTNEGQILGEDERLYPFHIGEWLSDSDVEIDCRVDFGVVDDEARNIMREEELEKRFRFVVRVEVSVY